MMTLSTPILDYCQTNHFQTTWQNESGTDDDNDDDNDDDVDVINTNTTYIL